VESEIQFLTIEVGSTITKANGFRLLQEGRFEHLAQGFAPTSVAAGDVRIGVNQAVAELQTQSGPFSEKPQMFVNSSAAGGLRMTVHGLTYNMTARAAREAALGAGAIVKLVTAGMLESSDLAEIRAIQPNIILLAGGVDYGEKSVVLQNARSLAELHLHAPVVYAGNTAIRSQIQQIFADAGDELLLAANVFPEVDVLNIEPVRKIIQEVFNRHIVHAPGMQHIAELTSHEILPTPGAVLRGAELFAESMGDCLVFDVGGATTDVHSVTDGSAEWTSKSMEPEPRAKRTVEGDLGVFINARNIVELEQDPQWLERLVDLQAIPRTEQQKEMVHWLCTKAVNIGVRRHAAVVSESYTPTGKKKMIKGKDLTAIQWIIGTGGALTRVDGGRQILRSICLGSGKYLLPTADALILMDRNYLFSALGTLAQEYPAEVKATFEHWTRTEVP
jgi:uncharacterized protein (TIGR01319 family)